VQQNLTKDEKAFIQKELKQSFANNSLKFNDEDIIKKVLESPKIINNFLMSKQRKTDDSDSKNLDYDTCESDEEFSKKDFDTEKILEQDDEEFIRNKTKNLRRYISKERGKIIENPVILKINQDYGYNFCQDHKLIEKDFVLFRISGKKDGIDPKKRMIIEVKSRNKFDANKCTIKKKEKIQSLVYLKLFDCDKCLFVESGPDGKQKIEEIEFDEENFNREVLDKLKKFTNYARSLTKEDFKDLIEKCNKTQTISK